MLTGDGEVYVRLLHILPFDAVRKRMSVIIEHPVTGAVTLLCKGADSAIFENLHPLKGEIRLIAGRRFLSLFSQIFYASFVNAIY